MVILHRPATGGGGIARYSRELGDALRAAREPVRDLRVRPWTVRVGGRELGGFVSIRAKSLLRPLVKRDVLHSTFHYAAHPRADVVTVHDLFQQTLAAELGVGPAEVRRMDAQLRGLARRQVRFVCDSAATRTALLQAGAGIPDEAALVVHPGVSPAFRPPEDGAPPSGVEGDVWRVLCVADLNPRKRVEMLLEAAALVPDPRLRIALVGALRTPRKAWGDAQRRIEALSRNLGPRLDALGGVGEAELVQAYQGADLLVMPSRDEGFGLPPWRRWPAARRWPSRTSRSSTKRCRTRRPISATPKGWPRSSRGPCRRRARHAPSAKPATRGSGSGTVGTGQRAKPSPCMMPCAPAARPPRRT